MIFPIAVILPKMTSNYNAHVYSSPDSLKRKGVAITITFDSICITYLVPTYLGTFVLINLFHYKLSRPFIVNLKGHTVYIQFPRQKSKQFRPKKIQFSTQTKFITPFFILL